MNSADLIKPYGNRRVAAYIYLRFGRPPTGHPERKSKFCDNEIPSSTVPPLRVRQAQNDPLSQNRHRRDLVGAETNAFGIRRPSLGGRGTATRWMREALFVLSKRDNIQTFI